MKITPSWTSSNHALWPESNKHTLSNNINSISTCKQNQITSNLYTSTCNDLQIYQASMQNYFHPTADQQNMQHIHIVSNWKPAHTIWLAKHTQTDYKSNVFHPHTNLATDNTHKSSNEKRILHTNRTQTESTIHTNSTQIQHKLNLQNNQTHCELIKQA